jgi:hypothetical protein
MADGISEQFETASAWIAPLQQFMWDVPGWLLLLTIGGVSALFWFSSRRATEAIRDDKRSGKLS